MLKCLIYGQITSKNRYGLYCHEKIIFTILTIKIVFIRNKLPRHDMLKEKLISSKKTKIARPISEFIGQ